MVPQLHYPPLGEALRLTGAVLVTVVAMMIMVCTIDTMWLWILMSRLRYVAK